MAPQRLLMPSDCSFLCHSRLHGDSVTLALTCGRSVNQKLLCKYLNYLCLSFATVKDQNDRTALHAASACGKDKVVDVLLKMKDVVINAGDFESGVTALHLALFHGHLLVARKLIQSGASLVQGDNENLLPMDYVVKDRLRRMDYSLKHMCEAYVWGTNANYTIGQGHIQNKMTPELLDTFRKSNVNVKKVAMAKFHSVFLDAGGQVYTCGHGQGGRLGLDTELAAIYPTPIKSMGEEICTDIAVGRDHTVFLMESGRVFACGSNSYHQLGWSPPAPFVLTPKPLPPIIKSGKVEVRLKGIAASTFHTVFWSSDSVFTCGLNAGHLGHLKGEKTIVQPKQVTSLILKETKITHVVASEGATLVATNKGDIYVLHEYRTRRIASKQHDLGKVYMLGGFLDSKVHPDLRKENAGNGLQIILLSNIGKLSVWSEQTQTLNKCVTNLGRSLTITDVAVSQSGFLLVTNDGEGYMGTHIPKKERKTTLESQTHESRVVVKSHGSALVDRLERDQCDQIKLKRIANIHRGVSAACDIKGTNFCVIQTHPSASLLEIPQVSPSTMKEQMRAFYEESLSDDPLHDVIYQIGYNQYAAHKYILNYRAESLLKFTLEHGEVDEISGEVLCQIEAVPSNVFEEILSFVYTGTCKVLQPGTVLREAPVRKESQVEEPTFDSPNPHASAYSVYSGKKKHKKSKPKPTPIEEPRNGDQLLQPYRDAARHFGMYRLAKLLDDVTVVDGVIKVKKQLPTEEVRFSRKVGSDLSDVVLVSEEGRELEAHRCVLAARLEYFRSMFGLGWIETSSTRLITLPLPYDLLEVVVDYLYEDDARVVRKVDDVEFICNVIVAADQFLIGRLREICEEAVTGLLTLKNVTEILQFADIYNAEQLKRVCMEYACLNLPAILENRALELLSEDLMEELSEYYRETNKAVGHRYITPKPGAPTQEMLEEMFGLEVEEDSETDEIKDVIATDNTKTKKNRSVKLRRRTDSTGNKEPENISHVEPASHDMPNKPTDDQGLKPVSLPKYKWSKVTSSSWRRKSSTSMDEDTKKTLATPVKEKNHESSDSTSNSFKSPATPVLQKIATLKSPVVTQEKPLVKETSPAVQQKPSFVKNIIVSFPSLEETVAQPSPVKPVQPSPVKIVQPSPSKIVQPSSAKLAVVQECDLQQDHRLTTSGKRPAKLSQKQRKQLAAQGINSPNNISLEISAPKAPWAANGVANGNVTPSSGVVNGGNTPEVHASSAWGRQAEAPSFAEIMKAEEVKEQVVQRPSVSGANTRSAPIGIPQKHPQSPQSPVKSPLFRNSLESPHVLLTDIMEEETRQRDNLIRAKTKPLRLTQIEDQAIEELLEFYGADSYFDERITVQRVITSVATPTWFR